LQGRIPENFQLRFTLLLARVVGEVFGKVRAVQVECRVDGALGITVRAWGRLVEFATLEEVGVAAEAEDHVAASEQPEALLVEVNITTAAALVGSGV
jgi:hypothetical protein